jgi:hypothetical protein
MKEMYIKGYIKVDCWKQLKEEGSLPLLLLLSRNVNTLRSNFRAYIKTEHDDPVLQLKDRLDLMFIHGSMIYEAVLALEKNSREIHKLTIWNEISDDYKFLINQLSKNDSFIAAVLKNIRNKLFFHFDFTELLPSVDLFDQKKDIHFITSKSEKSHDLIYSFNDDLTISYLSNLQGEDSQSYEKIEKIQTQIIDLSDKLTSLCEKIIKYLLHDKAYKKISEL